MYTTSLQHSLLRTCYTLSQADLFIQTPFQLLLEAATLQLLHESCSFYNPITIILSLSMVRYSFIQLSKLRQSGVNAIAQVLKWQQVDSKLILIVNPGAITAELSCQPDSNSFVLSLNTNHLKIN